MQLTNGHYITYEPDSAYYTTSQSMLLKMPVLCICSLGSTLCHANPLAGQLDAGLILRRRSLNEDLPVDLSAYATSTHTSNDAAVICGEQGSALQPVSLSACMPVLELIRMFPKYDQHQDFIIDYPNSRPQIPSPPPYSLTAPHSDCLIHLFTSSMELGVPGYFSWKDVVDLSKHILNSCDAGLGGLAAIGDPPHQPWQPGWTLILKSKQPAAPATVTNINSTYNGGAAKVQTE